jgi:hypothetical protein
MSKVLLVFLKARLLINKTTESKYIWKEYGGWVMSGWLILKK